MGDSCPTKAANFFDTQSRFRSISLKSNFGLHARLVSALVAGELLGLEQKRTTTTLRWLSTTTRACQPTAVYRGAELALALSLKIKQTQSHQCHGRSEEIGRGSDMFIVVWWYALSLVVVVVVVVGGGKS